MISGVALVHPAPAFSMFPSFEKQHLFSEMVSTPFSGMSLDASSPSASSTSSSSTSPTSDLSPSPIGLPAAEWANSLKKISEPINDEMLVLPSCKPIVPGLFSTSLVSPQGFGSFGSSDISPDSTGATNTPSPPKDEHRFLVNAKRLFEDEPEKKLGEVVKPPRLTVNGKRVGRPPGTTKVSMMPKPDPRPVYPADVFTCMWGTCSEKFRVPEEFFEHVRTHHGEHSRQCHWRGCYHGCFSAYYMLLAHLRIHTKEKPHRCEYPDCHKEYSRLENLKTHRRTHTGEKPYPCEKKDCQKRFTNASDRAKHQNRTHSDAKPYRCHAPGCEKAYTDPSSLRKHFKAMHHELMHTYLPYSRIQGNANTRKRGPRVKEIQRVENVVPVDGLVNGPVPQLQGFHPAQMNLNAMPQLSLPQLPLPQLPTQQLPLYNPLQLPISNPLMPMPILNNQLLNNQMPAFPPNFLLPQQQPHQVLNQFTPLMNRFHPLLNPMLNPIGGMGLQLPQLAGFPQGLSMMTSGAPMMQMPIGHQPIFHNQLIIPPILSATVSTTSTVRTPLVSATIEVKDDEEEEEDVVVIDDEKDSSS